MQRQRTQLDPFFQAAEQRLAEVQAGGRRGDGPRARGRRPSDTAGGRPRPSRPCGCRAAAAPPDTLQQREGLFGRLRPSHPRSVGLFGQQAKARVILATIILQDNRLAFSQPAACLAKHRQRPVGSASRNRPCQWPPVWLRTPTSRAGRTRVSLSTRQSPATSRLGKSRIC